MKTYLVTGGAGFIGSNFVLKCRQEWGIRVINLDKLTYAGNPENLSPLAGDPDYIFVHGDICDREFVNALLLEHRPDAVVNFAAESHVDRSIVGPAVFVETNINGTFCLLEESLKYWRAGGMKAEGFRFLHVSTDEVFGSLGLAEPGFQESTPYRPNSPYSASKAAADHLVRAYFHTYGFPGIITNCSNNYGPRQFPEKLIPLMILNAAKGKSLPVYGDGLNVRDWLFVEDHCDAIHAALSRGKAGETYNIGGCCEKTNIDVVQTLCRHLDELLPDSPHFPHASLIRFIKDRPGHDRRYAIDCAKIRKELGWQPRETFESGLLRTIQWYLDNPTWVKSICTGEYRAWIEKNYDARRTSLNVQHIPCSDGSEP